jgi:SNF2 family DNA or RNA helicase
MLLLSTNHLGAILECTGCLGDDMGMGKTFMTLSLLGGFMRAKTIRKALVVAPVSVLRNWENEARRILGMCVKTKIQVIASEASKYAREKKLKEALEAQTPQLVITTLGLVSSSPDQFQHRRYSWDYIIVDEGTKKWNCFRRNLTPVKYILFCLFSNTLLPSTQHIGSRTQTRKSARISN